MKVFLKKIKYACSSKKVDTNMTRRYKKTESRDQGQLFPAHMDDYVDDNHLVRAIDAYVENLDLSALGYQNAQVNEIKSGQPAYPPAALLKLYFYGYINRITSSRRLERECHRNLEVFWLMENLKPSYKTISDFRRNNKQAIRKTHKEFILFCKQLDLFAGECIAIDGSFFKGNVSHKSFITTKGLQRDIARLDKHIADWQAQLDQQDQLEKDLPDISSDAGLPEKLEELKRLQARKEDKTRALEQLKETNRTQQSRSDPDARLLRKGKQVVAGYNVQIVTDSKYHLIAADKLTSDANDLKQLYPLSKKAQSVLSSTELEVLADGGYYSAVQIAACEHAGITPYVPVPRTGKERASGRYAREQFEYDEKTNQYICPANQVLKKSGQPRKQHGQFIQRYTASETSCKSCSLRDQCIKKQTPCREVWRSELSDTLSRHRKRMNEHPEKIRQCSASVEHPFGTIKVRAGWHHFLLRGRDKVAAELSLMLMSYNFTRVLNILGIEHFIQVLKDKTLAASS